MHNSHIFEVLLNTVTNVINQFFASILIGHYLNKIYERITDDSYNIFVKRVYR